MLEKSQRLSGIELLKILGIFLIVISHVTQTLMDFNTCIPYHDYMVPLGAATESMQILL